MGSITPEHYGIAQNEMCQYFSDVDEYLSKKWAAYLIQDVKDYIDTGNKLIGKADLLLDGLKFNSDKYKKWIQYKTKLQDRVNEVRQKYSDIY